MVRSFRQVRASEPRAAISPARAIALATDRDDIIAKAHRESSSDIGIRLRQVLQPPEPKFSRAMALSYGPDMTFFISGTASIINSESDTFGVGSYRDP